MTLPPDLPDQPRPGEQPPLPPQDPAPRQGVGEEVEAAVRPDRRSRKGLIAGSTAAVVLLGGAGAWAYSALGGGGAQPEAVLPASTLAYLDVDLDPSAAQKINLLRLANRVPDLADGLGVDLDEGTDLKQLIAEAVTRDGECEIDYATDLEPWIGDRAAAAALPGEDESTFVLVLAVTDEEAARTAIQSGLGCGESIAPEQVVFSEGFAVVTGENVSAQDVVAHAAEASLADDAAFAADMEALGDTGLASFWMDMEAVELLGDSPAAFGALRPDATTLAQLEDYTSAAGALRTTSDSIELATVVAADEDRLAPLRGADAAAVAELPDTTLLAAAAASDPGAIDTFWEQLPDLLSATGEDPAEFDDSIALLADQYDIHLPEDLKTFLGEQVVLAVDSEGLDDVAGMSDITELNVGLRVVGDTPALQDLADRVNALVSQTGVGPLATAETKDGLALATNDDYAQALTGGRLGASEAFRSVADDEDASSVLFVDLDRLTTLLSGYLPGNEVLRYLEPLRALGVVGGVEGGHATSTVRLSFN